MKFPPLQSCLPGSPYQSCFVWVFGDGIINVHVHTSTYTCKARGQHLSALITCHFSSLTLPCWQSWAPGIFLRLPLMLGMQMYVSAHSYTWALGVCTLVPLPLLKAHHRQKHLLSSQSCLLSWVFSCCFKTFFKIFWVSYSNGMNENGPHWSHIWILDPYLVELFVKD